MFVLNQGMTISDHSKREREATCIQTQCEEFYKKSIYFSHKSIHFPRRQQWITNKSTQNDCSDSSSIKIWPCQIIQREKKKPCALTHNLGFLCKSPCILYSSPYIPKEKNKYTSRKCTQFPVKSVLTQVMAMSDRSKGRKEELYAFKHSLGFLYE